MPRPSLDAPYESLFGRYVKVSKNELMISGGFRILGWLRQQICVQRASGDASGGSTVDLLTLALAGDQSFCRFAVEYLARYGGKSSDVEVDELDGNRRWGLARASSRAIRDGNVTPDPPHHLEKPKSNGTGHRRITMFALHDRVIQTVLGKVAECVIDPLLPVELIGSRSGCSRLMLIERLRDAAAGGQTFLLKADLRNAFDNVPLARLRQVLRRWLPPRMCELIMTSLHSARQTSGIPQGHVLSPRLLNVYTAQTILPRLREEFPGVSLTLYVDDLIAAGESREQMLAMGHRLEQLATAAGFSLKHAVNDSVFDMATIDTPVEALGYGFRARNGILDTTVSASGWDHLEDHFVELHRDVDAPLRATEVIRGWLAQNSPCLNAERKGEHVQGVLRRLRRCGLGEWPDHVVVDRLHDEALGRESPDNRNVALPYVFPTIEPWHFPDDELEEEVPEPLQSPRYFAFVHAWNPRKVQLDDWGKPAEPIRGGWAWVIKDSGHRILDHGCGTAENTTRDLLFLDAIEELANHLPFVTPENGRVELVIDSASYKHRLEEYASRSSETVSVNPTMSFRQRHRHVTQRLNSRVLDISLLPKKDLKEFESSERGRMAKTVRFWAEQAAIDSRLAMTVESAG